MTHIPTVILNSLIPRRVFLPLECLGGKKTDWLFKRARKKTKVAVYWEVRDKDNSEQDKVTVSWQRAIVGMNERLPWEIWESSVNAWTFNASDKAERVLKMPREPSYLDLAINLASGSDFGLIITWNPRPNQDCQEISHLLITDDHSLDDTTIRELVSGEPLLTLFVPRVALLPLPENGSPESGLPLAPPGDGLIKWTKDLLGVGAADWIEKASEKLGFPDERWQFRPPTIHVCLKHHEPKPQGCALALDFGTCVSTIAYLPILGGLADKQAPAKPLTGLGPWSQACTVPNFDRRIKKPEQIGYDTFDHAKGQLIKGIFPVVPHHVQANRLPLEKTAKSSAHVPSLLYALPKHDLEGQVVGETVLPDPQCIIGSEAWSLVERDLKQRDFDGVDWDSYVFAPKSRVGKSTDVKLPVEKLLGENPVELFLTEFLDQAFYRLVSASGQEENLHRPIEVVSYSYPVAWNDQRRRELHDHLVKAIQKSAIRELLADGGIDRILREDGAMDEGSAAFLGFVMERFGGLDGGDLLRVFQPFDPRPDADKAYPKKLNVLVFDCGEGTTDVVWLEIIDDGDNGGGPLPSVESHVRRHFAMEKAGLEVTRRIAERIKEQLRKLNPNHGRDWLRTNLLDEGIGKQFHADREKRTEGQYRRGLINLLYLVAERVKLGLVTGNGQTIPWAELKEWVGANQVPKCALTAEELVLCHIRILG